MGFNNKKTIIICGIIATLAIVISLIIMLPIHNTQEKVKVVYEKNPLIGIWKAIIYDEQPVDDWVNILIFLPNGTAFNFDGTINNESGLIDYANYYVYHWEIVGKNKLKVSYYMDNGEEISSYAYYNVTGDLLTISYHSYGIEHTAIYKRLKPQVSSYLYCGGINYEIPS